MGPLQGPGLARGFRFLPAAQMLQIWAQNLGAKCESCPLSATRDAVPPEPPVTDRAHCFIVGESPNATDEVFHRPFSGETGLLVNDLLDWQATPRSFSHLTNSILCRPGVRMSPGEWKKAIKCCSGRLEGELATIPDQSYILAFGARAMSALTGHASITAWRGYPLDATLRSLSDRNIRVFPTFHPGYILQHPHLLPILKQDVARFFDWKQGRLTEWVWPDNIVDEGPDMIEALERMLNASDVGVDVETGGINPFTSELLCVGLADRHGAISVEWPPRDRRIEFAVRDILRLQSIGKTFQNGNFDKISLERWGIDYATDDEFDTLIAHRVVAPGSPHDLGFIASMELGGPRWKTLFRVMDDRKGGERFRVAKQEPARFRDMRIYNGRDALMTQMLKQPLMERMNAD